MIPSCPAARRYSLKASSKFVGSTPAAGASAAGHAIASRHRCVEVCGLVASRGPGGWGRRPGRESERLLRDPGWGRRHGRELELLLLEWVRCPRSERLRDRGPGWGRLRARPGWGRAMAAAAVPSDAKAAAAVPRGRGPGGGRRHARELGRQDPGWGRRHGGGHWAPWLGMMRGRASGCCQAASYGYDSKLLDVSLSAAVLLYLTCLIGFVSLCLPDDSVVIRQADRLSSSR